MKTFFAISPDGTKFHRKSVGSIYEYAIATRGHRILRVPGWNCLHWCRDQQHAEELATALNRVWAEVVVVAAEEEKQ
jgi:hypothetical protein